MAEPYNPVREHLMDGNPSLGEVIWDRAVKTGATLGFELLKVDPQAARRQAVATITREMVRRWG